MAGAGQLLCGPGAAGGGAGGGYGAGGASAAAASTATLVLFIENEPAIAGAMVELLAGWSCEVVAAATAEDGLARLAGRRPDVILSDYHLDRGRTGLEALAVLRARLGPSRRRR